MQRPVIQVISASHTARCLIGAFWCLLCALAAFPALAGAAQEGNRLVSQAKNVDSYTITQRGDRFRVGISYPHLGTPVADAELAIWARDQAATFTKSVQMIPTPTAVPYELTISYERLTASSKVVSVVFFIGTAMGGAHPEPGLATFVYEKRNGRRLSYDDIFLEQTNFLETLSVLCRESLIQQLKDRVVPDMLEAGTAPESANFDLFTLTRDGLRIYFPPYQAAPYSEGYLTVTIPLSRLAAFKPQKSFWDKE